METGHLVCFSVEVIKLWSKASRERRVYLADKLHSIIKGSQSRNWSRGYREKLFIGLLSYLSDTAQSHQCKDGIAHSASLMEIIPQLRFPFPVYVKFTTKISHHFMCVCVCVCVCVCWCLRGGRFREAWREQKDDLIRWEVREYRGA